MVNVYLHGALGEEFGEVFELEVKSPVEALRLLEANFHGRFCKKFVEYSYRVVRGDIEDPKDCDDEDTLALQRNKDIHFVPVVEGAGFFDGWGKIILGIVIIAIAWYAAPAFVAANGAAYGSAMGATAFGGLTYGGIAAIGASIAISGVASLLTPTPELKNGGLGKSADPNESFLFGGAQNTIGQGQCIPVVYGEMEVGSIVISESLSSEHIGTADTSVAPPTHLTVTRIGTGTSMQLRVSWAAPDDADITGYEVQYVPPATIRVWQNSFTSYAPVGGWVPLALVGLSATTSSITRQQYEMTVVWFRVRSVAAGSQSDWVSIKGTLDPTSAVNND